MAPALVGAPMGFRQHIDQQLSVVSDRLGREFELQRTAARLCTNKTALLRQS
jgi:hypothetical protein